MVNFPTTAFISVLFIATSLAAPINRRSQFSRELVLDELETRTHYLWLENPPNKNPTLTDGEPHKAIRGFLKSGGRLKTFIPILHDPDYDGPAYENIGNNPAGRTVFDRSYQSPRLSPRLVLLYKMVEADESHASPHEPIAKPGFFEIAKVLGNPSFVKHIAFDSHFQP